MMKQGEILNLNPIPPKHGFEGKREAEEAKSILRRIPTSEA
jgi:hypothetical protein